MTNSRPALAFLPLFEVLDLLADLLDQQLQLEGAVGDRRRSPPSRRACWPRGSAPARGSPGACPQRRRRASTRSTSSRCARSRSSSSSTSTLVANRAISVRMRSSSAEPIASRSRSVIFAWYAAIASGTSGATFSTRARIARTRSTMPAASFAPSRLRAANSSSSARRQSAARRAAQRFVVAFRRRARRASAARRPGSAARHRERPASRLRQAAAGARSASAFRRGARAVALGERDAAVDFAARDARRDQLAQHRLERAQLVGDAELQVEEARVDRAQLEAQRAAGRIGRRLRRSRSCFERKGTSARVS